MKYSLPALAAVLLLMTISCRKSEEKTSSPDSAQSNLVANEQEQAPAEDKQKPDNQIPFNTAQNVWDKKIIRNVELNVEVEEFRKYRDQIRELIEKYEGYVANEAESSSAYDRRNMLIIKVPVAHLDEAVNSISLLKGKLLTKRVSSDDVTAEVFDTRARMEAKKKVRLRYIEMLHKAKNMEEVMQVEREINQIQEQIEAAEGRLNYLSHSSAMSTIHLTFFEVLIPDNSNVSPGYGKRLGLALNEGLAWLANLVIVLATLWPLWIIVATVLIAVKRLRVARVSTSK